MYVLLMYCVPSLQHASRNTGQLGIEKFVPTIIRKLQQGQAHGCCPQMCICGPTSVDHNIQLEKEVVLGRFDVLHSSHGHVGLVRNPIYREGVGEIDVIHQQIRASGMVISDFSFLVDCVYLVPYPSERTLNS